MVDFVIKNSRYFCWALLLISPSVLAERFCFSFAESYYQQLYCQVQAAGKGKSLPELYEFSRNSEQVQALLLKRPAADIGVKLVMPAKRSASKPVLRVEPVVTAPALSQCQRNNNRIVCAGRGYQLVGNYSNDRLSAEALSAANRMQLADYQGSRSDADQLDRYLQSSYRRYLLKMIDIGLGGATLSYGKFSYLFEDLNSKGLSFSERFETMYRYLKKDKRSMAVPAKSQAPAELVVEDCYLLEPLLVCRSDGHNWLFR